MNAQENFGGVPKTMLTDQMRTVILGMGDDRKPRWHPLFEDFGAAIGMILRFAAHGGQKPKARSNEAFSSLSRTSCREDSSRISVI